MSEEPREQKVYVPIRGMHVEPSPNYAPVKPDRQWRIGKYRLTIRWTGGSGFYLDRKEQSFRCWHLYVYWKRSA